MAKKSKKNKKQSKLALIAASKVITTTRGQKEVVPTVKKVPAKKAAIRKTKVASAKKVTKRTIISVRGKPEVSTTKSKSKRPLLKMTGKPLTKIIARA